jgi:hypothetical protein
MAKEGPAVLVNDSSGQQLRARTVLGELAAS